MRYRLYDLMPRRFLTFVACVFFLSACTEQVTPEQHIANARAAMAAEDYATASIELKNALQQDGRNAEARLLLGEVHLARDDFQAAGKELERASDLGANPLELGAPLARALLKLGEFERLDAISVDGMDATAKSTVLAAQALAAGRDGDFDTALGDAEAALAVAPDNLYAMAVKARVYAARREFTLMREQVEAMVALDDTYGEGWLLMGDVESAQRHLDKAEAAYTKAVEYSGNPLESLLRRAFVRIELGQFDEAQEDVTQLLEAAPHNPSVNYAQGIIQFQRQEMQEAVSSFAIAERNKRRHPMALLYAGIAHFSLGNLDQAAGFANQFHNMQPDNVPGRKLLAAVLLAQRNFERAEELIRPVVASNSQDVAAMNLLANALISQDKTEEAIDILGRVAQLDPNSSAAQIRLGASLLIKGESAEGVEKLESALELNPEFQQADILLVLNYVERGDSDAAIKAAKAYRARNPAEVTPLNLLGRVYRSAGDREEARDTFNRALKIEKGNAAALQNLAEMALEQGDNAAARGFYEEILAHDPTSLAALLKLADMDARENKADDMIARLELAVSEHPGALRPKVALARAYMATNRPEQVAIVFSELDDSEKSVPAVLNEMARAQLAMGEYAAARFTLNKLESMGANTAQLHHQKAVAAAGLEDRRELQRQLEKSIEAQPDYLPARLALARLMITEGELERAKEQVAELKKRAPEYPDVLLVEARIFREEGDNAAALKLAERAHATGSTTNTLLLLSLYQRENGLDGEALKLLEDWVENNQGDLVARRALAELYMQEDKLTEVMAQYQAILERDDDNLVALNNLAWYLLESDPERALSYAKRAQGVAPDAPAVLDTLALAQYHNDDLTSARRTMRRAVDAAPDDPSMLYHLAMLDAAAGDKDGARLTLDQILAEDTSFPEREKAEALRAEL